MFDIGQLNILKNNDLFAKDFKVIDQDLYQVCQDFESLMVEQMYKAMRQTIPENDFLPRNLAQDVFEGMLDQELAQKTSALDSLGLGRMLYQDLIQQNITPKKESDQE